MPCAGEVLINSECKPAESEREREAADGSEGAMRDFKRGGVQRETMGETSGGSPLIKDFLSRRASLMAFSQRTA